MDGVPTLEAGAVGRAEVPQAACSRDWVQHQQQVWSRKQLLWRLGDLFYLYVPHSTPRCKYTSEVTKILDGISSASFVRVLARAGVQRAFNHTNHSFGSLSVSSGYVRCGRSRAPLSLSPASQ